MIESFLNIQFKILMFQTHIYGILYGCKIYVYAWIIHQHAVYHQMVISRIFDIHL